jgi:hypothetical protein
MTRPLFFGILFGCLATGISADFDGDGMADDFTTIRNAAKGARAEGIRVVNPWQERSTSRETSKAPGLRIRLSRTSQTYLLQDRDFFSTPMWAERKLALKVITRNEAQYKVWKKRVPGLLGDAIELGTEAGIDILLYWTGKQWRIYWPPEDP